MSKISSFRPVRSIELNFIKEFLKGFGIRIKDIIELYKFDFFVSLNAESSQKFPSIYLVPQDLAEFFDKKQITENSTSAGIYFGFIKRSKFHISLEGTEFLYFNKLVPETRVIKVNPEAEKSFLYGNNLKAQDVIDFPSHLKKGDFIIISNELSEFIGIGVALIHGNDFKDEMKKIIIETLKDKGYYLRAQQ